MTDSKIFKLSGLIDDIKKVDEMIAMHKKNLDVDFMLSQYQAKKIKLTSYLINELNTPPFKSTTSIFFIKRFLDKFYADSSNLPAYTEIELNDLQKLEAAL